MKCSFCGSENCQGAMKCTVCGSPLTVAECTAPSALLDHVRCPSCGATLPVDTLFCTQCGTRLNGSSEEEKSQMQQEKDAFWNDVASEAKKLDRKRKKVRIVGWIVKLAGLVAVALLIRYSMG